MSKSGIGRIGVVCVLLTIGAAAERPDKPKSPKATDALRMEAAAIREATYRYWGACRAADLKLENQLQSAADLAHDHDDGAEEQACREAAKDAEHRAGVEADAGQPASPPPPFRFEAGN